MKSISIITQNLNGKYNTKNINKYTDLFEADIYAFQELKEGSCHITDFIINYKNKSKSNDIAKKIWDKAFPWVPFKSGYWMEVDFSFDGKNIKVINYHCSPTYSTSLRYVLLNRLDDVDVNNKLVILLGDFNAAFVEQTENYVPSNHEFLLLVQQKGYKELIKKEENKTPHYTFVDKNNKKKKLDHIFISDKLWELSNDTWEFSIEYIDEVNTSFSKTEKAFTDHSGIKLSIVANE